MLSQFCIRRPIFASVMSILIVIAGLLAGRVLPMGQYPDITPPVVFILTSYEDELYEQEVFDVYQIFDFERYLSEPQERVELHYKLIQQVVKYHKQLELWKKEIESLLPQKGQSAAIDKRILELDSKLEKSIDGHAAIPDEVKNDLKSNKLDELIDKIDLLLKED